MYVYRFGQPSAGARQSQQHPAPNHQTEHIEFASAQRQSNASPMPTRARPANSVAKPVANALRSVAALHTDLMKQTVFADLHRLYPTRINNKTNGITPRRWLNQCNPGLTELIKSLSLRERPDYHALDNEAKKAVPFWSDAITVVSTIRFSRTSICSIQACR